MYKELEKTLLFVANQKAFPHQFQYQKKDAKKNVSMIVSI